MARLALEIVADFVRTMLRPIVAFCVKRSLSYPEFCKLAKQLYLDTAQQTIGSHQEGVSVSRISALTGLDRRDITRFQKEGDFFVRKENLLCRVLGQWEQDPRFRASSGKPRGLSCEGIGSDFFALVQSVSKDLNPYSVLSELERTGAVARENGMLKLHSEVYVPRANFDDALRILGSDVQDLLSAVGENVIQNPEVPHLHIRTYYDNLSLDALSKIQEWFLTQGAKLHKEVRKYLSRYDKDINPKIKKGGGRAVLTSFAFVERPDEENF